MAFRYLSPRFLVNNLPNRTLVASSGTNSKSMSTEIEKKKPSDVGPVKRVKKVETLRSWFSVLLPKGGKLDHRDPDQEPIPWENVGVPHIVEKSTGEQKLLMLAFEQGYVDPYCNLPVERRGAGTKDNPVKIKSFTNEHVVGCHCEANQNHIKYTVLHKDEPKRCYCGHWMQLVDAPKFWLDIPKEELLTIPYFLELELEGKLDAVLKGEEPKDHKHGDSH